MIKIFDFTSKHIKQASQIAAHNYARECEFVPTLPSADSIPDLTSYAENQLGVAALDGDEMVGFLCCVSPFKNAFRSTDATGVFSPMGANGAVGKHRSEIYARMYESAGAKWAGAGASSHAVCLYAHDREAQEQFFQYGFGMRCVDAIRGMDEIDAPPCEGYDFAELTAGEYPQLLPLCHMLDAHMASSPTFILRPSDTEESLAKKADQDHAIYFAASENGRMIAFIRAGFDGETFVCGTPGYMHVNGAFCMPDHRGKGIHRKLLSLLIQKLRAQGYERLGVDFESINPAAHRFWPKHFDAYTASVVRRIDEHAI